MPRLTSRLSGVNEVLRALGRSPVSELQAGQDAITAEAELLAAAVDLQTLGWWFNRVRHTPTLLTDGYAFLPEGLLLEEGRNDRRVEVRQGQRLYDRDSRTYDWGTPTNLLSDVEDLNGAAWTLTSTTAAMVNSVPAPFDARNDAFRVTQTTSGGLIEQVVPAAGLTDGTRYAVGAFVGVNEADTRSDSATGLIQVRGAAVARDAGLSVTFSRNLGRPLDVRAASRSVEEAVRTDFLPVGDHDVASSAEWRLVYIEYDYETADGDARLQFYPVTGGQGSYLVWRPFFTPVNNFPVELRCLDVLEYEDLPSVVQRYLVRRAAVEMATVLDQPTRKMNLLLAREAEAYAALQRVEQAEDRASMCDRSPVVARATGRLARRGSLRGLYGEPLPGHDA